MAIGILVVLRETLRRKRRQRAELRRVKFGERRRNAASVDNSLRIDEGAEVEELGAGPGRGPDTSIPPGIGIGRQLGSESLVVVGQWAATASAEVVEEGGDGDQGGGGDGGCGEGDELVGGGFGLGGLGDVEGGDVGGERGVGGGGGRWRSQGGNRGKKGSRRSRRRRRGGSGVGGDGVFGVVGLVEDAAGVGITGDG